MKDVAAETALKSMQRREKALIGTVHVCACVYI